ncbi:hypothetical protein JG688_00009390 [Phytophthora aleatoria]|uniref:Uncharacterized protein n=1 Tax=Phytophthora aleatoria TaxID=2496075 RepID=A0A8J5IPJ0_9STRA|nr:hypothetical protein JG688_00009390 [Phytophthora aleatoria]
MTSVVYGSGVEHTVLALVSPSVSGSGKTISDFDWSQTRQANAWLPWSKRTKIKTLKHSSFSKSFARLRLRQLRRGYSVDVITRLRRRWDCCSCI